MTLCPVVWLTRLGGSTATEKRVFPHGGCSYSRGSPGGGHGDCGAAGSPCQGSPAEELNGRQQSGVELSRSQQGRVGSPPAPPSQPELPGDTGRDWLRHLHATLKFLWCELNPPVPADTHAPTPCNTTFSQGFFHNQRPSLKLSRPISNQKQEVKLSPAWRLQAMHHFYPPIFWHCTPYLLIWLNPTSKARWEKEGAQVTVVALARSCSVA